MTDGSVAEDAQRAIRQLRPGRWRRHAWRPLALPASRAKARVESREPSAERDHRAEDELGDSRLMSVYVRQRDAPADGRSIDPVQAGARHLDEPEPRGRSTHFLREDERDEHIDL